VSRSGRAAALGRTVSPRAEAGTRQGQLAILWSGSRSWTAAVVFAAFPFVFIIDEAVETALSPVLPSVVVLIVLIVALPFLLTEVAQRRLLRLHETLRPARSSNYRQSARAALGGALLWFLAWLVLGA
jgi:uncharacterized membrane protein YbhN (UPF0104 family)